MPSMPTKSDLKKNLAALKERLVVQPMDLDARMRLARTLRLLGKGPDAVAHYGAVARYLSLAGHPLQAIAVLKELLQVDPQHEETLLFLAKLYARTRAADGTNRGRVAVPILDGPEVGAFPEGIPETATALWRAIRPTDASDLSVVKEPEDVGAETERLPRADVDAETKSLDDAFAAAPDLSQDFEILGAVTTEDLVLPQVPLFSSLSPDAFVHLGHAMVFQRAAAGASVFRAGDPGDSMVVVAKGRARVHRVVDGVDVELAILSEGDFAGVFALMAGQPRQADLSATTDLEYFEIDRLAVDDLVRKHPQVKVSLQRFFRERLILNLLATLPVFSGLTATERRGVAARFVDRRYDAGDELFFEGAEHDGLWLVLAGKVDVVGEGRAPLGLVPGDYVGTFAGVDAAQADLGAVATTPTRCALLTHKSFTDLLRAHKDLARARDAFAAHGLMVGQHVFCGDGRMPEIAKVAR